MKSSDDKDLEIINLRKNNSRLKITVGILSFFILLLFIFASVQQGIAIESQSFADEQQQKAIVATKEALRQQKIAEAKAMEAMKQYQRAEEALKKICK